MSPLVAPRVGLRPGALSRIRCCRTFSASISFSRSRQYSASSESCNVFFLDAADLKAESTEPSDVGVSALSGGWL